MYFSARCVRSMNHSLCKLYFSARCVRSMNHSLSVVFQCPVCTEHEPQSECCISVPGVYGAWTTVSWRRSTVQTRGPSVNTSTSTRTKSTTARSAYSALLQFTYYNRRSLMSEMIKLLKCFDWFSTKFKDIYYSHRNVIGMGSKCGLYRRHHRPRTAPGWEWPSTCGQGMYWGLLWKFFYLMNIKILPWAYNFNLELLSTCCIWLIFHGKVYPWQMQYISLNHFWLD